jgi:cytoskeletal protein CcmA (bactofilin family)
MIFKRSKQTTNGMNGTHKNAGPSIIAQDVVIEGNVTATGELHIDGTVYGTVRANSCVVDMNGFVQGEIIATEIFIRGRVIGPISGNNVNLYAGAQVEGDILNQSISIENGANVYGMISRLETPVTDAATAPSSSFGQDQGFQAPVPSYNQDNSFDTGAANAFRPVRSFKTR